MPNQLEKIKQSIYNEKQSWPKIQELKKSFDPRLFDSVNATSKQQALERAIEVVHSTLGALEKLGLNYLDVCPGHAAGHITRDYVNSLTLFSKLEADQKHLFVGFAGGIMHDIGCAVMDRYLESKRAVRHAEAGALLLEELFADNSSLDLNDAEKILIKYAVAAHAYYKRDPEKILCSDGETRIVTPYQEVDKEGNPIWGVWFAKWVDRLDCSGPTFPARHYLTLGEDHEDYDGESHFNIEFADHMRPLLRPFKEQVDKKSNRNQTMSEHVKMFADSNTNDSPYGKHDFGAMIEFRDFAKEIAYKIIQATQEPKKLNLVEEVRIIGKLNSYLTGNIEPTVLGLLIAQKLTQRFIHLPETTRFAWLNGFQTMMREYKPWSAKKLSQLEEVAKQFPGQEIFRLPMTAEDIREVIKPNF